MPKKFKNVSPSGALVVPVLGRTIEPDEVFEVSDEIAEAFAGQASVFEPVLTSAEKKAAKAAEDEAAKAVEEQATQVAEDESAQAEEAGNE